ncbi:phytoene desaturase family protein [Salinimicrobium catena]|uniref:phytoene desaturase family protein n=1 Tax=Salinimicrobium catena TaxID=390640 RepID=UPI002FE43529
MARIAVIGSGFSGISAAAYLGAAGHEVHVFEKNETAGGRARQLHTHNGYTFDMGPSWYWMPDVFEKFFADFGFRVKDLYDLQLLNPSFDVVFGRNDKVSVPENYGELKRLFERIEPGSGVQLDRFMEEARYKYEQGMQKLVYMPGLSLNEFIDIDLVKGAFRLQVFSSFSKHVRKFFKHPKLIALMEFPVLFLGAMPQDTPALYSLMNYAGLKLGTWYPQGGFGSVIRAMVKVAEKQGVRFHFQAPVEKISIADKEVKGLMFSDGQFQEFDAVVGAADYQHIEGRLLPPEFRNYRENYWQKKTFAPSCLIYYLGFSEKIPELEHHTLFFDEDLYDHSVEIYKDPKWPEKPLFYACCPSRTDITVAPEGHENLFLLMPLAPGLEDAEEIREKFFDIMLDRLENQIGRKIRRYIDYKQSYCVSDFVADYNSYKGNAYGLANTLQQTAILKPKIRNKKLSNLFYAGQLTVPGPGVPPSLISGKIAAEQVVKELKKKKHEVNL